MAIRNSMTRKRTVRQLLTPREEIGQPSQQMMSSEVKMGPKAPIQAPQMSAPMSTVKEDQASRKQSVKFNDDDTVTVTGPNTKGEWTTSTVSKKDYNATLPSSNKGYMNTPEVNKLLEINKAEQMQGAAFQAQKNAPLVTPEQLQIQQQAQLAAQQIGLTPQQQTQQFQESQGGPLETVGTIGAGVAGGVAAAGTGAAIGTLAGGPVGTAVGAALGGAVGFIGGVVAKNTINKRNDIKTAKAAATGAAGAINNMQFAINEMNKVPRTMSPFEAVEIFDKARADFEASRRYIRVQTKRMDRSFTDAEDELVLLDGYAQRLPNMEMQLRLALTQPNPQAIVYSQPLPPELQ